MTDEPATIWTTIEPATLLMIGKALDADHPTRALAEALKISHRSIARMLAGTLPIPALRQELGVILAAEVERLDSRRRALAQAWTALGPWK
jgi:hypothetical protein